MLIAESQNDLIPNARLGHYVIIEHIAEGGMGHVYKGFEASLQREVAIKVLKPDLAVQNDKIDSFDREAQSIAALRHPNIVPIYFVGHQGELHYFVMPFVEGSTLDDWIERGVTLTTEQATWVLGQAIEALDWAYQHDIVHLDIKPSNFLVDPNGLIYLTDFGLAQTLSHPIQSETGECFGTPAYMSPEQIMQQEPDLRSDIYSLGATMYHLMTGMFLHDGETITTIIRGHIEQPFPLDAARSSGLPPGWIALLQKMAERNIEKRYQAYGDLRNALQQVDRLGPTLVSQPHKTETEEEANTMLPVPHRTNASQEYLFGLLSPRYGSWTQNAIDIGIEKNRAEVVRLITRTEKPMRLNRMAPPLREIMTTSDVDIEDLLEAMAAMPEVDIFLLSLANTDFTQPGRDVTTRRKAIRSVGVDLSRQLILLALALRQEFRPGPEFDWRPLWQHSVATGLITRYLLDLCLGNIMPGQSFAKKTQSISLGAKLLRSPMEKARDAAFAAGLVHGFGKLVFAEVAPYPFYAVMRKAIEEMVPLRTMEKRIFGMDHLEAGLVWLEMHRIDSILRHAASGCEDCQRKSTPLAYALALANQISRIHGFGYSGDPVIEFRNLWKTQAWRELKAHSKAALSDDAMEEIVLAQLGQLPLLEPVIGT